MSKEWIDRGPWQKIAAGPAGGVDFGDWGEISTEAKRNLRKPIQLGRIVTLALPVLTGCVTVEGSQIQESIPIVEEKPGGIPSQQELCKEAERPALTGVVRKPNGQPLIGVNIVAERIEKNGCPPERKGTGETVRTTEDGLPIESQISCKTVWTTEEAKWTHMSPDGVWDEEKWYPVFPAGYYQVPGSFAGSHEVRFEAEGYQPETIEVDFSCGEEQELNVVLSPLQ